MYSLWDEASRDVEAENAMRRSAMAEAEIDRTVFSFVALSKTENEYNHRKALVAEKLDQIAEKTGSSFDDVMDILDSRMAYILEAAKLAADEGEFIIVDANGSKIGGPYPSREAASAALSSGKFESIDGARVISQSAQGKSASKKDDEQDETDSEDCREEDHKKESSIENMTRLIRQSLQEGKDPIDWVTGLPSGGGEGGAGETSQHSTDSDPAAHLPGGDIPATPPQGRDNSGFLGGPKEAAGLGDAGQAMMNAGRGLVDSMRPVNDMFTQLPGLGSPNGPGAAGNPTPNNPGVSPTAPTLADNTMAGTQPAGATQSDTGSTVTDSANGVRSTGNLEARIAAMRDDIARYNPNLSPERVNEVAQKVAKKYLIQ